MARKVFANGTVVKAKITFTDPDTALLTDPVTVSVAVRQPSGTTQTYVYLTNTELVRQSTGIYYIFIPLTEVGTYKWKWIGAMVVKKVVVYGECDSEKEAGFA